MFEDLSALADIYNVEPAVFIFIYIVSIPFYYYPMLRINKFIKDRSDRKKLEDDILISVIVNRLAWAAPYFYVIIFGRNLPVWIYFAIFIYLFVGVVYFINRMKKGKN